MQSRLFKRIALSAHRKLMRAVLASVLSLCSCMPAFAVDYRWTLGFAQGTSEAIIENADGSSVNVYCPSGQEDHTPGMFISSKKVKPEAKERVTVQIIVDGKNHPFYLEEIQFQASTRIGLQDLTGLVDALAASHQKSFTVEFPKYNVVETFSLRDARKSLGRGKDSVLVGCDS